MDNIQNFIGGKTLSISETMQKIDKNTYGILFIVDNDNVLFGCVTDGDLRRYLLSGGQMSDSVIEATNRHPKVASSIEEAIKLYHKKNYIVIPIVDEKHRMISLYSGEGKRIRIKSPLNVPVVINAGGKGTRLEPFTKVLPKPLIPVGELPIIEQIIQEYQTYDCNEFHIIVNYKKELMKAYFKDNDNHYDITWYDEDKPLGTGGGLSLLRGKINETFFFANCDVLLLANYESILKFHKDNRNTITMICAYKNFMIPYGVIEMGNNGVIESMREKPTMSFLTNTGIYIVEPEVLNDIEDGVSIGFPDIVEQQKQKGRRVAVFPVSENDWLDMGQLPELENMINRLHER